MSHGISSHCPTLEVAEEVGAEAAVTAVASALVASTLVLPVVTEVVK